MPDRREEIVSSIMSKYLSMGVDNIPVEGIFEAMDEYVKEVCLELLEYMAKKGFLCGEFKGEPFFQPRAGFDTLTKEQLFENFL